MSVGRCLCRPFAVPLHALSFGQPAVLPACQPFCQLTLCYLPAALLVFVVPFVGFAGHGCFEQGVERVASAVASLTAAGTKLLPQQALQLLSAARQDAVALCGAMARLDDLLAARERAQMARRRTLQQEDWRGRGEAGGLSSGGGGGGGGGGFLGGDGSGLGPEERR